MEIKYTNILYYKFNNSKYYIDIRDKNISSVNSLEFIKNI